MFGLILSGTSSIWYKLKNDVKARTKKIRDERGRFLFVLIFCIVFLFNYIRCTNWPNSLPSSIWVLKDFSFHARSPGCLVHTHTGRFMGSVRMSWTPTFKFCMFNPQMGCQSRWQVEPCCHSKSLARWPHLETNWVFSCIYKNLPVK